MTGSTRSGTTGPSEATTHSKRERQVDAVMDGGQVLVALLARSIAETGASITLPQWRVLVLVRRHGELNLTGVATGLGVHPSTASRTCDPLVRGGLLAREEHPDDRRHVALSPTPAGAALVAGVLEHRRRAVGELLGAMPATSRDQLARALAELSATAGETDLDRVDSLGWVR